MSMKHTRPMILDFIGWNLTVLGFMCFLYLATTQEFATIKEAMSIIVPLGMIVGGLPLAMGMRLIKTDLWLSGREIFDGLLWFIVCFGAIITINIGVVNAMSHTPFNVTFDVSAMATYGMLIAIAEEICFRGFFLPFGGMMTHLFGFLIAVPVSAGAWTLFHLYVYGTQPLALIIVFMVGCLIGFVAWYKRRLWIVMGAHALANLLAWTVGTMIGTMIPILLITTLVILWVYARRKRR